MSDTTTSETSAAGPELSIVDLQNIRQLIDIAARRGAFHAAEMTSVGMVFNKLDAFLNAVASSEETQGE